MKRLVLVDGNALLHRAYHATPPFTLSSGELINAVFGFTNMLLKSLNDLKPDYIAIAWDKAAPTFRHVAYTQYKATRGPSDQSLHNQYERVHEVVDVLNIPEFGVEGYEADDLIGTLAKQGAKEKDLEVIIITGDRDILQVIEPKIKVLMPKKTLTDVGLYGEEEFREKYGFEPIQMIDFKGLAGDASDNIPGVPGIGGVTATKLIQQFGSVENIYKPENLGTLPERTQKLLAEGAESAIMSKSLATIELNSPIKLDLEKCTMHDYDRPAAIKLFEKLEFKSMINRLPGGGSFEQLDQEIEQAIAEIKTEVKNEQSKQTTELDTTVDPVLKKMSEHGVLLDMKFMEKLAKELHQKLDKLEKDIYHHVGHEFNLNSPKQLADVLFDELGLPVIRKTKTGRSTDEATLNELKPAHPAIPLLLEYRMLFKLCSTYVDSLPKTVDEEGRIHTTFNVEGSATGRISSNNPNLQNIPIRSEIGAQIRKAFITPKGKVILGADYSQVELRIMAHVSGDENLQKAFKDGLDIHAATAAKIFDIPVTDVTKDQRAVGKTMNFATLYGQGPHALSQLLGVEFAKAKEYIDAYFEQFPKVKAWMAKTIQEGNEKGYVETIWGRRRFLPELKSPNRMLKSAGERQAINHPIQGTNADMIKKAIIEIDKLLDPEKGALILQVHDELLLEVHESDLEAIARLVQAKMESAIKLAVPVTVDLKSGPSWGATTPLKLS